MEQMIYAFTGRIYEVSHICCKTYRRWWLSDDLGKFYSKEKTSLVFIKANMNCFEYRDILDNNIVPPKDELRCNNLVLLQDNVCIFHFSYIHF